MAAIQDIQTALLAKAATLTDAIDKAECEAFIAEYVALRGVILELSSKQLISYSTAGRSQVRADLQKYNLQAQAVRAQIGRFVTVSGNDTPTVADFSQAGEWAP
jgi:hypothetical protein